MPEPTGVVALLLPDEPALLSLVSLVAPAIASGNTVVALVSAQNALAPLTFAEVVATSDIPAGVVNLLSGDRKELSSHFASHMDVNALVDASGDEELSAHFQAGSAVNVKRYRRWEILNYFAGEAESPYFMMETVEMKTAWHPIGL